MSFRFLQFRTAGDLYKLDAGDIQGVGSLTAMQ